MHCYTKDYPTKLKKKKDQGKLLGPSQLETLNLTTNVLCIVFEYQTLGNLELQCVRHEILAYH